MQMESVCGAHAIRDCYCIASVCAMVVTWGTWLLAAILCTNKYSTAVVYGTYTDTTLLATLSVHPGVFITSLCIDQWIWMIN